MKRRFNSFPIVLFSLLSGLLGLGLQFWQQQTGVDPDGLLTPGHPATYLLFGLSICVLLILIYIATGVPKDMHYSALAKGQKYTTAGSIFGISGILATLLFGQLSDTAAALCIAGAGVLLSQIYVQKNKSLCFWASCAVTVFLLILPLSQYPAWCVETQIQNYAYLLLATLCLMLAAYHRTEGELGIFHCKRMVFFHCSAIYFGITSATTSFGFLTAGMALWCAFDLLRLQPVVPIRMPLPETVAKCIRTLTDAGYPAYAVGGCVRDTQLGQPVQDYDLCTSATPDQIANVFSQYRLIRAGEKHGTIGVVIDGAVYEITTFRAEGEYKDNRHPDWVSFVDDLEMDLARRDFTVNAMAYSPVTGLQDPWHGMDDLKRQILRAVGDPEERFREDALRILRGVRFSIRYDLTPDAKTGKAMMLLSPLMERLARERVFDEMCKLLPLCKARDLLRFSPVFLQVIPELKPTVDFHQRSPHHAYDVFTHTAYVVENAPKDLALRWAALLHDIGKPDAFTQDEDGRGHFYGHADISAEKADALLLRLKAPTALREKVVFLIKNHMLSLPADPVVLRRRLSEYGEVNIQALLQMQRADYAGKGVTENMPPFELIEALIENILAEEHCLHLRDLAVNGRDLMAVGFPEGRLLGEALTYLLDCVVGEKLPNEREALLDAAARYLQERTNKE
ncbi:MAG: HD domain-containing protein [Oscillospiraceae bacterium]|nr:HD domain-containing protein [Oscillospiraceae bacterium]